MNIHPNFHLGTSGWSYAWQDIFYPPELRSADYLPYYATRFNCTEINSCFYHYTMPKTIEKWLEESLEKYASMTKDLLEDKKDVWVFFNNTMHGQAVTDSGKLTAILGKMLPRNQHHLINQD